MAKKYYLIPFNEEDICFNGVPINEIYSKLYPDLVDIEEERVRSLASMSPFVRMTKADQEEYNLIVDYINVYFDTMHIPKYIVAYGDTKTAYESITGTVITPKVPNALSVRDVKREIAEEYFNSTNYKEELGNFYRDYIDNMDNPFEMGKPKRKREPKGGE